MLILSALIIVTERYNYIYRSLVRLNLFYVFMNLYEFVLCMYLCMYVCMYLLYVLYVLYLHVCDMYVCKCHLCMCKTLIDVSEEK